MDTLNKFIKELTLFKTQQIKIIYESNLPLVALLLQSNKYVNYVRMYKLHMYIFVS